MDKFANNLKNMYKMKIAKEFKTNQAWTLLKDFFFKPVSGSEAAIAIGDKIFTDMNNWMRDGF